MKIIKAFLAAIATGVAVTSVIASFVLAVTTLGPIIGTSLWVASVLAIFVGVIIYTED